MAVEKCGNSRHFKLTDLSLGAQVAVSTFFMKSPVFKVANAYPAGKAGFGAAAELQPISTGMYENIHTLQSV